MADLLGDGGSAGFPTSTEGASAGAQGVSSARPARRRPRGAQLLRGTRDVKDYPVTGPEIWELGRVGLAGTVCFSLASWFLGKSFDLYSQLKLSGGASIEGAEYIRGMLTGFVPAGCIFLLFGIVSFVSGGFLVNRIISETRHE